MFDIPFKKGNGTLGPAQCLACRGCIGSYGTRNVIEVMESWFWERPTDCLVLKLMMSVMITV